MPIELNNLSSPFSNEEIINFAWNSKPTKNYFSSSTFVEEHENMHHLFQVKECSDKTKRNVILSSGPSNIYLVHKVNGCHEQYVTLQIFAEPLFCRISFFLFYFIQRRTLFRNLEAKCGTQNFICFSWEIPSSFRFDIFLSYFIQKLSLLFFHVSKMNIRWFS